MSGETDLTLIPIQQLLEEIMSRSDEYVIVHRAIASVKYDIYYKFISQEDICRALFDVLDTIRAGKEGEDG